ncbi:MAG: dipeptide epimerase [Planctomycetes bacterium]|nr:dipeptide epimerase [Planctomycetota bacterium]
MRLTATPLDLPLRHRFTIARHSVATQENVLVRVRWRGLEGLGEAAPMSFYGQTRRGCQRALERMGRRLQGRDPFELEDILADLRRRFPREPSAVAAVDMALHDLIGKKLRMPLWRYWGLDPERAPQTSFTIGIDTIEKVADKVREAERYPVLKIKLGVAHDLEIMREVRRLAPKKRLRVDANCGWSVKDAIAKAKVLEKLGVEFIEQPLPAGHNADLKRISQAIGIPLMADESSLTPEDLPGLVGCVAAINIKLVKCGGLREAMKMVQVARACGFKIMVGCMIESSVLITAAAHLAPLIDYADLDGNLLISKDPFRGVRIDRQARLLLPRDPGLGVVER